MRLRTSCMMRLAESPASPAWGLYPPAEAGEASSADMLSQSAKKANRQFSPEGPIRPAQPDCWAESPPLARTGFPLATRSGRWYIDRCPHNRTPPGGRAAGEPQRWDNLRE